MKMHYLSVHSVLEHDEFKLLTELGHDVFSNGSYNNPVGHSSLPRPGIEGATYHEDLDQLSRVHPKTKLPPELIDPFDVIIIMSGDSEQILIQNWDRIKHKRVIWRSIGQSLSHIERRLKRYMKEGLEVVRYSKKEQNLNDYAGHNAIIPFYKDPNEWKDWNGNDKRVINFSQSLKNRGRELSYDYFMEVGQWLNYPATVYGPGNNNLGPLNGGELPYENMKQALRDSRVYLFTGTWPAPYTLSFIEAWMTGIPIVSIGHGTFNKPEFSEQTNTFEVPDLIDHGKTGFVTDDPQEAGKIIKQLMEDDELARRISDAARGQAIERFGKEKIKQLWQGFLQPK